MSVGSGSSGGERTSLSREQWQTVIDATDAPTIDGLADAIARRDLLDTDRTAAVAAVEQAVESGALAVDGSSIWGDTYALAVAEQPAITAEGDTTDDDATAENGAQRALDAFAVAVDYFHQQLDRELPESAAFATPREYYTDGRGWDHETVAEHRLGYAPADPTALLDRLMREGFDRDAILGTGLFYESLDPHFRGRYVIPYFDRDGRPCYAISRSLDEHDGSHPNDPKGGQKYTKAIKTKDYSHVDEPIFGLDSVDDDTDRLLVAGGIADAIALQAAGYACISPVTTVRFKHKHERPVVELVDDHDIDRVYIINDAERPSISAKADADDAETIADALTIEPFGEGLRGAFANADFLTDAGIETRLVTLPGGDDDLDKVDPDDFIQDNWGSIETLLAAANPASEHYGYQTWDARRQTRAISDAAGGIGDTRREGSTGANESRLFSLNFEDVSGLSEGYRGKSPLGHHGSSEDYYVVVEPERSSSIIGYDHKYGVAHNALTYRLCEAGERRAERPTGTIEDSEMLAAWLHAKREGLIPDDDPVPHHALRYIAVDRGLCERDEITDGWMLPADAYNAALDAIADEIGVDPGREPLDTDRDGELDAGRWCEDCEPPLSARADPLDVDARRDAMTGQLYDAFADDDQDALTVWAHNPGEGKTTSAALAAAQRDRNHVMLLPKHENCREFQRDESKPDGYFHLKGAAQPIGDACMDASIAADDEDADGTADCPDHGHLSNCPSMCPVYDLDTDDARREAFDALAATRGVRKAHAILGFHAEPWHGETCAWADQWNDLESADRVVTVHNYLTLKTVREHGDVILDDASGAFVDETMMGIDELTRCRQACRRFGELAADDEISETLTRLAVFVDDLLDALTGGNDLGAVSAPTFPTLTRTYDSPGAVPDHVPDEQIRETRRKRYVGERGSGQFTYESVIEADERDLAERLAQAKHFYEETIVERFRRGEWDGTPFCLDAVFGAFAAVADDPTDERDARIAAGIDVSLDACPRCYSELHPHQGARMCPECGWHEAHSRLTQPRSRPARIDTTILTGRSGVIEGLATRRLPDLDELPDPSDVLLLDATPRQRVIAAVFGIDPETVRVDGDNAYSLPNATVTQIVDGAYHRSTLKDSATARQRAQRAVERINDMHDTVLYVTINKARGLLDWPDDAEVMHYYALRGLDRPDADAVVCVGAPHPDERDLRADARVLAADNPNVRVGGRELSTRHADDADPPVYRKLNYVDDDGTGRAVAAKTYSGITGDLFDGRHADEIEQAAHRNRPILATEDDHRYVYLLTNVPTGLPVDRLTTYDALLDPLGHGVDVRDSALDLLDALLDAADDPDLGVDYGGDGESVYSIRATGSEWVDAAQAAGLDMTQQTVSNARGDLCDAGLVVEGAYLQRRGRVYTLTELGARVASGR